MNTQAVLFVCILPCHICAFYYLSSVNCASRDIVALFTSCQLCYFYFHLLNPWLSLAGGNSAIARLIVLYCFIFFYQPEVGTVRRHLRNSRPVDCIVLFIFFCQTRRRWPEAPPPQSSDWHFFSFVERDGTGRRHLRHSPPVDALFSIFLVPAFLSIYLFLCLLDQWWPNSHPVGANYPLLEPLCVVCLRFLLIWSYGLHGLILCCWNCYWKKLD